MPKIFEIFKHYPRVTESEDYQLFLMENAIYGICLRSVSKTQLVEFDDDEWLHDNHHEFRMINGRLTHHLTKLFSLSDIYLRPDEEVFIENVRQLSQYCFLIMPLRHGVYFERSIIVNMSITIGQVTSVEFIPAPPA